MITLADSPVITAYRTESHFMVIKVKKRSTRPQLRLPRRLMQLS
jgi:hypothetical protein